MHQEPGYQSGVHQTAFQPAWRMCACYVCHAWKLIVTNLKVTNGIIKSQCWRIKEKAVAMLFFLQNTKSANRAARVLLLGAKIL